MNKINWLITWFALGILKKYLGRRLRGEAADYLQQVKKNGVNIFNRIDFILQEVKNKKVLHVGFTDYPFTGERINNKSLLHLQLQNQAASLAGLDLEGKAIEEYTALTGDVNVFCGDIVKAYPAGAIAFDPDIILLAEVLEHLKDPHKAIDILYNTFNSGTKILVTVPNYTALDSISASLNKTESIHPHHYWYFSPYTLCKLFDDKRFVLEQMHFGMYYKFGKRLNFVMRSFNFNADCIMAIYSIKK